MAAGALGAATIAVQFGVPNPSVAKWSSTGFDDWVRGWLRIPSENGRNAAALTSDFFVYTLAAAPFINAFFVAGWEHERMDVAWKLAALDAETLLTVTFVTLSLQKLTAGNAPSSRIARSTLAVRVQHRREVRLVSERSHLGGVRGGGAGVLPPRIPRHLAHRLGAAVCPVTIVVATGTAILRVAADRHWATDVITGALLGGGLGYAIPALHLVFAENKDRTAVLTPAISSSYLGVSIAGRW